MVDELMQQPGVRACAFDPCYSGVAAGVMLGT
jgi:hypothetical protein